MPLQDSRKIKHELNNFFFNEYLILILLAYDNEISEA